MENEKDLAENILDHRKLEIQKHVNIWAVGRWSVIYDGKPDVFWMIRKENKGINRGQFALVNNGKPIYYNSKLGETLQRYYKGDYIVDSPEGKRKLTILNRVLYIPHPHSVDATKLRFSLNGQEDKLEYRSLRELLDTLDVIEKDIKAKEIEKEEAKKNNSGQAAVDSITEAIAKKQQEKEQVYNARQNFIRDQMHLQKQPHLSGDQNDAKRSLIYDGTMIIDGGPGTGKTTSLIERIKFLIDPDALKEYLPDLSDDLLKLITNPQQSNWIFFSPNQLLSEYLKESMNQEDLKTDSAHLNVWEEFKQEVLDVYGLIGINSKAPFTIEANPNTEILIKKDVFSVKQLIQNLEQYANNSYIKRLEKANSIDVSPYSWSNLGKSIQGYITSNLDAVKYNAIVKVYNNLYQQFGKDVRKLVQEGLKIRSKFVNDLYKSLSEEQIGQLKTEIQNEEISTEEDSTELFLQNLLNVLKTLLRKIALSNFEKISFNKKDKLLLKVLPPIEKEKYRGLGDLLMLQKYMSTITKGVAINLLSRVPTIYKSFRKNQIKLNSTFWNLPLLKKTVESKNGKILNQNEAALLLNFINESIIKIASSNSTLYNQSSHEYISAYRDYRKCVIAVDEASDFHLVDLKCIHSFRHFKISSITYSGDIMQRMTAEGISKWTEMNDLVPNTDIYKLSTSYRQSPTLIDLAKKVYYQTNQVMPEYKSYKPLSPEEPKPLLYIGKTENIRTLWIANRINDIVSTYKHITQPTIAVFVSEEELVLPFSELLADKYNKLNPNVKVMPCLDGQELGEGFAIRVFSIEHIKGLEFEAVFFHNLDGLERNVNIQEDLALKFLYVGISRATFYLAVTASSEFSGNLKFLNDTLSNDLSWTIRL